MPFPRPHRERLYGEAVNSGNLLIGGDPEDIGDCSICLVCVPTPADENNDPDLAALESACRTIAPSLAAGDPS